MLDTVYFHLCFPVYHATEVGFGILHVIYKVMQFPCNISRSNVKRCIQTFLKDG